MVRKTCISVAMFATEVSRASKMCRELYGDVGDVDMCDVKHIGEVPIVSRGDKNLERCRDVPADVKKFRQMLDSAARWQVMSIDIM